MIADTTSQVNKYFCCLLLARRATERKSSAENPCRKKAASFAKVTSTNDYERSADYFATRLLSDYLSMQTVLLSCLFGAVCTMVLWAAGSANAMRDRMLRRGGELSPPEET